MKIKLKYFFEILSVGFIIVFFKGIFKAVEEIYLNRYLYYKMYRLILSSFSNCLQVAIKESIMPIFLWVIFIYFSYSISIFLFMQFLDPVIKNCLKINIYNKEKFKRLFVSIALCLIFLIYDGWLVNHLFLPKNILFPRLLFNSLILPLAILLWVLLIQARWEVFFELILKIKKPFLRMIKFTCIILIAFFLFLRLAIYVDKQINVPEGPNIILITIDTLRADHLSCYGYERSTTPNIDNFARKKGILFQNAFTSWPLTTPAFAGLFTSQFGHSNGVVRKCLQVFPLENLSLAEVLKNYGYNTAAVVSNVNLYRDFLFNQGFDYYLEGEDEGSNVTKASIQWLRGNAAKKRRIFFWVHYLKPHAPYVPIHPFDKAFVNDEFYGYQKIPLEDKCEDNISCVPRKNIMAKSADREQVFWNTSDNLYYYISQYDGEIKHNDKEVGDLLDEIEQLGLLDNSIIIITSDHGESLGDHDYYFSHGLFPYRDCSNIPLIISFPVSCITRQTKVEVPVSIIDIMPTIFDVLDIEVDKLDLEGESVLSFLSGERYPNRYIYAESGVERIYQKSVRNKEWELIYIPTNKIRTKLMDNQYELYNVLIDPAETDNLITRESNVANQMKAILNSWIDSWKDSGIEKILTQRPDLREETKLKLKSLGYL